ncbi:hypothetical protein KIPB_005832 [Kipferlia bialata]|uniref:Uncharacterized protein n=1 Tax=Kipferlia bialata TaxID=797122 RepID=A0A9K3GIK0_9EUKA|nr:hypothetical protein KIPB_005832 [Kipferlia bialata]|eukprot:g5832.t1
MPLPSGLSLPPPSIYIYIIVFLRQLYASAHPSGLRNTTTVDTSEREGERERERDMGSRASVTPAPGALVGDGERDRQRERDGIGAFVSSCSVAPSAGSPERLTESRVPHFGPRDMYSGSSTQRYASTSVSSHTQRGDSEDGYSRSASQSIAGPATVSIYPGQNLVQSQLADFFSLAPPTPSASGTNAASSVTPGTTTSSMPSTAASVMGVHGRPPSASRGGRAPRPTSMRGTTSSGSTASGPLSVLSAATSSSTSRPARPSSASRASATPSSLRPNAMSSNVVPRAVSRGRGVASGTSSSSSAASKAGKPRGASVLSLLATPSLEAPVAERGRERGAFSGAMGGIYSDARPPLARAGPTNSTHADILSKAHTYRPRNPQL